MAVAFGANWIGNLPEPVQAAMRTRMVRRRFDDGQYVYRDGDTTTALYQIVTGGVRLRTLMANGKEFMWVVYGPGDCIGFMSAIDDGPRPQDAIAVGRVELNCMQKADFDALRAIHPEINSALMVHLVHRLRELYNVYLAGNFLTLRQRLANQIEFLLNYSGSQGGDDASGELELTQEMLATAVCATRQAISKLLREWGEQGIISYHYGRLQVTDRKRLRVIAQEEEG